MSRGAQFEWDAAAAAEGLRFSGIPQNTVTVTGSGDGWHAVKTIQAVSSGVKYFEFDIVHDARTSNTWKMVLGCVPNTFICNQKQYTCVGSSQGHSCGWGYCGGTGHRYSKLLGPDTPYGPQFTTGDIIGMLLDFTAKTVTFFKNGTNLGIAFSNLSGAVCPAISMTAKDTKVTVRSASPPGADPSKMTESERLAHLEREFSHITHGAMDLTSATWAAPLDELHGMGFTKVLAVEALLVTFKNKVDLPGAIEYLFLDEASKLERYRAQIANKSTLSTPASADAAVLLKQIEEERKKQSVERKKFERDAFKHMLAVCVADGTVRRFANEKLSCIRRLYGISDVTQAEIFQELSITNEKFEDFLKKGREEEEKLRNDFRQLKLVDKYECVVCMERVAEFVVMDCMHICFCEPCVDKIKEHTCPKCRRPSKEIRKIFY